MNALIPARRNFACALSCLLLFTFSARADDWPTYLRDNQRVGASTENLEFPLKPDWTLSPPEKPEQAWPGPEGREIERKKLRRRNTFDDAFHVAVVGDRLYYGSSVDHQVHCLNLETGETIWTFFTEGPIRLAPTIHEGKLYIGSDDGYAYCLDAGDGSLVWKMRPGPSDERIIGRQQFVSRWPVRTGVSIQPDAEHGAVAYFGAGVFPHELVYLYAVRASDGEVIWKLDNISQDSAGRNDLSPQGYLLTTDEILVVPSGRSLPAVFDRKTGKFLHKKNHSWRRDAGGVVGSTQALLADGQIFAWGAHHVLAMDQKNGNVGFGYFQGHQMAVDSGEFAYIADGTHISKVDRDVYGKASIQLHRINAEIARLSSGLRIKPEDKEKIQADLDKEKAKKEKLDGVGFAWKTESPHESRLIVSGNAMFTGGQDEVVAFSTETGEKIWSAGVDGEARGLAVANGRLIVSTTTGDIVCFSPDGDRKEVEKAVRNPFPDDDVAKDYADAAEKILAATGVRRGFCLVVGAENGQLAYELAKRTDLEIYAVEPDEKKVEAARRKLAEAGYYGTRISIHHGSLDQIPYANYFANLIVSDTRVLTAELPEGFDPAKLTRHLKPVGGKIVVGVNSAEAIRKQLGESATLDSAEGVSVVTRGPLPGAGSWSHQYGEAGNTACSYDYRVKGGLGVLWYGDPGEGKMVNRHEGAVSPLAINGRLFAQGEERILAYDAYNGLFLWERENPDSIRTGVFQNQNPGNLVASDRSLFFMQRDECIELDAATGEEKAIHFLPETVRDGTHQWGYVAYQDGILFGTATIRKDLEDRQKRRGRKTDDLTDGVFAVDVATGKHLWHYTGKTIEHRTVSIGDEAVYFIDSTITQDQRMEILRQDKTKFAKLSEAEQKFAEAELKKQDIRLAVALDARSGEKKWEKAVDVTDCSEIGIGGGKLTLLFHNNVLLLCGANANGHYWKQFMAGEFSKRRLLALSGTNGEKLWSKDGNYRHRPIIVGDEIIAEPWSFDLYTGNQKMRKDPITGEDVPWSMMRDGHHCGMVAATPNMLTFRSRYTGFYDLEKDIGTKHFAGHRTGCWINAIPANGLISIPESSAGCVCLFSIASTIVMEPREEREDWAMFSSTAKKTPVKHIALNFGAPGDRRAADGTAWLAYPRPRPERQTSLDLAFDCSAAFARGGGYVTLNESSVSLDSSSLKNAAPDWAYTSWANGLLMARIPLLGKGDAPAKYTVRLHMAAPAESVEANAPGRKSLIRLQGKEVAEGVTVQSGDPKPQILEFNGIEVTDELKIEQWAEDKDTADPEKLPVLNAIEIVREDGE
ncbi:MAG: PQQ-binding-like beta-propeller repeat protein [Verrucomicrobiales bacterium]|nr:PQQ-binding-like beta-propeller repeat protein [Verrucomicrobiales bacterium]